MDSRLDPELQNFYSSVKTQAKTDHTSYIRAHPEIRQLLNDYFSSLLLHKPPNVYSFTRDYFAYFNKKKEGKEQRPLLIVGGEYCGKREVCGKMLSLYPHLFRYSVGYTTRPMREGEMEGREYHFIDRQEFAQRVKDGDFIAYTEFNGELYGTSKSQIQSIVDSGKVCLVDCSLADADKFVASGLGVNVVYLLPPPVEEIRAKIINAGEDSADKVERQVNLAKNELESLPQKTYIDRQLPHADTNRVVDQIVDYMQGKYPQIILK